MNTAARSTHMLWSMSVWHRNGMQGYTLGDAPACMLCCPWFAFLWCSAGTLFAQDKQSNCVHGVDIGGTVVNRLVNTLCTSVTCMHRLVPHAHAVCWPPAGRLRSSICCRFTPITPCQAVPQLLASSAPARLSLIEHVIDSIILVCQCG